VPTDPKLVRDHFLAAAELPAADRAGYLNAHCGDAELRDAVERLLAAHDQPASVLNRTDPGRPEQTAAYILSEQPGAIIAGRYKLLEQIGEGGMGTVFLAEQTQPVRRKVALKLIKPGMDSKTVLSRFMAERQALATMDHPNIAKVLDGGSTEGGRPFFVMEYVKGVPFTQFCDDARLSVAQRLTLFVPICQAVQHAHQKGIIHRDLKPSNILVCLYDGVPVPKVIDFGLAKAMHQPLTEHTLHTAHGLLLGTPLYMSPEQAEFNNLDVDTRTDIYALGVILYELLTGTTPLEQKRLKEAAWHEMLRVIKEEEPPRPSTRLSGSGSLPTVAAQRGLEPVRLTRLVRGELDWIAMKALEKDRTRRYETANGLARDIERYLADEAVEACPPSMGYRFRKLARKYRVVLATAAAFACLLVLAAGVSAWLAVKAKEAQASADQRRHEAERAERQAAADRDRAQDERQRAEAATEKANRLAAEEQQARQEARRSLYVANVRLAQRAWEEAQLDLVVQLLDEAQRRRPGDEDLRGFEWHYLWRLAHPEVPMLKGHSGAVFGVAFSPDGQLLATASGDKTVKLWDTASRTEIRTYKGHTHSVERVVFSPDGRLLATASRDKTVRLWETATGQVVLTFKGHTDQVWGVAFSPDGKRVASTGYDNTLKIWETATGKELISLVGDNDLGTNLAMSPDGQRVVAASNDPTVKLWDTASGKHVLSLKGHTERTFSVVFSPDGQRLASAGADRMVKLWETATGKELLTLKGHASHILCVAYSPNGQFLASGSEDRTVKLWETTTGKELHTFKGHTEGLRGVTFSPDGKYLASCSQDRSVRIWETSAGRDSLAMKGHTSWVGHVAFSPDNQRLASSSRDNTVKLWDVATGKQQLTLKGETGSVGCVAFSPDGQRLASGSGDNTVKLWEVATGKELLALKGHTSILTSVAFGPNAQRLASGSYDGTVRIWDTATGKELLDLRGHAGEVFSVAFSPDGQRLASAGAYAPVKLWDTVSGKELLTLNGHTWNVSCVTFSPDGQRLATAGWDHTIKVWEVAAGKETCTLKGHGDIVRSVVFSPDGRRLASSGDDRTVRIWLTASGKELLTLQGHTEIVCAVAFSSDGQRLASASADHSIHLWETIRMPSHVERQRAWQEQAMDLVDSLFTTHVRQADVIWSLRSLPGLNEPLRQRALIAAEQYHLSLEQLIDESGPVVRLLGASGAAYRRALLQAEEACRIDPQNPIAVGIVGMAQYRLGQFEPAVATLQRADQPSGKLTPQPDFAPLAFLAMAQHQVGRKQQALETLARLRQAISKSRWAKNQDNANIMKEVETLLQAAPPSSK
jgi:WD40 repeat protein